MPTEPTSPTLLEQRLAQARAELERRLQEGERRVCEDLFTRYSDLWSDAECALELVYTEFAALELVGENPEPIEFYQRFPPLRDRLARVLKIHTVFDDGQASEDRALDAWPWHELAQPSAESKSNDAKRTRHQRIGNYELLQEVGRGGMGIVFKARQAGLGRLVALKMIRSPLATQEELSRFRNEAATDARLEHPNIISIHEINEYQGCPYLCLEYVEGGNLADRLADRPIRAVEATRLIETLARAVGYAHEHGVVHRDLKPANILLTTDGQPKIADFGLAKLLDALFEDELMHRVTQTGAVVGTPCYMSPEQTGGKPNAIGPATDIYSLGTLLYEMLTGRPPFQGESTIETLDQIRHHEPPPPRRFRPRLPRDFETICLKCLEKESVRRYPSAVALADDLARALAGEPIVARPVRFPERAAKWVRRRPAIAALLAAVVLVTLVGATGVVWQWRRAEEGWRRAETALAEEAKARRAELALRHEAQHALYLHLIATTHRDLLSHRFRQAEISLDQCHPQFRHWEWHYLSRLCHPELMELTSHSQTVRRVNYLPDGQRIVTATGNWGTGQPGELKAFHAETGEVIWETEVESGPVMDLAISPDGKLLATACVNFDSPTEKGVTLWDSVTGKETQSLPASIGNAFATAFSPDGKRLATGGSDGIVRIFDVGSTDEVRVLKGHTDNVFDLAFRPDGVVVASASRDSSTRIWDVSSGALIRSLPCGEDQRSVVFSPDGRRLATAGYGGAALVWDLSSEGTGPLVLRVDSGMVRGLSFAPDGQLLAGIDTDGSVYLWEIPSGERAATIYGHDAFGNQTAFSPNGLRLASASGDHTVKIWDLTAQPSSTGSVTGGGWVGDLAYSPDGRSLAVASNRNQVSSDYVDYAARIIDLADRTNVRTLTGHSDWLTCIVYNSDGSRVATGSWDHTIRIWDPHTGESSGDLGRPHRHRQRRRFWRQSSVLGGRRRGTPRVGCDDRHEATLFTKADHSHQASRRGEQDACVVRCLR